MESAAPLNFTRSHPLVCSLKKVEGEKYTRPRADAALYLIPRKVLFLVLC